MERAELKVMDRDFISDLQTMRRNDLKKTTSPAKVVIGSLERLYNLPSVTTNLAIRAILFKR